MLKTTLAIILSTGLVAQTQAPSRWSGSTRLLSPSVAGTLIARNGVLELAILWRGAPGWSLGNENSSGGGSGDSINGAQQYGQIRLDYSYTASTRIAEIQGKAFQLPGGMNVIMVDNVDHPGGGVVSGTARIVGNYEAPATPLPPILAASPEVVRFLRCETPLPADGFPRDLPDDTRERLLTLINRVYVCDALNALR